MSQLAAGNIPGRSVVNKFGNAPDGIQTTDTDIWSRANSAATQQIWLAPTAARVHALVSSSAADDFVVQVRGLKTWDSEETSENVTLNGQTPVNTVNSYVIIHRMKCVYTAAKTTNAGTITATAAVDNTVTAVILPGDGQTEMAIYGVPSTQKALIYQWGASIDKGATSAVSAKFELRINENPNVQTLGFLRKDDLSLQSTGINSRTKGFMPPFAVTGPAIIKIQAVASAADVDGSAGFDMELVTL
jgi:hypothetical protein